jgi:hypothetical protein
MCWYASFVQMFFYRMCRNNIVFLSNNKVVVWQKYVQFQFHSKRVDFKVLTAVRMNNTEVWRRIVWYKFTVEPSVNYQTTRRRIPEDSPLHIQIIFWFLALYTIRFTKPVFVSPTTQSPKCLRKWETVNILMKHTRTIVWEAVAI